MLPDVHSEEKADHEKHWDSSSGDHQFTTVKLMAIKFQIQYNLGEVWYFSTWGLYKCGCKWRVLLKNFWNRSSTSPPRQPWGSGSGYKVISWDNCNSPWNVHKKCFSSPVKKAQIVILGHCYESSNITDVSLNEELLREVEGGNVTERERERVWFYWEAESNSDVDNVEDG